LHGSEPRIEARRAAGRAPGDVLAWIVLAEAELDAGDARAGEAAARHALTLGPGHPEALARLGRAQWMLHRHREAADSLRAAARAAPRHPGIAVWLGHVLEDVGEAEEASETYARAHALAPQHAQIAAYLLAWRRRLCDWRDLEPLSAQVREAVRRGEAAVEPFAFLSEDATAAEQLQCARLSAAQITARVRPPVKSKSPLPPFFKGGKATAGIQTVTADFAGASSPSSDSAAASSPSSDSGAASSPSSDSAAASPSPPDSAAASSPSSDSAAAPSPSSDSAAAPSPSSDSTAASSLSSDSSAPDSAAASFPPFEKGGPGGICSPLRIGFLSNGFGAHPTGSLTVAFFESLRSTKGIEAHLFALNADDGSGIRRRLEAATTLHDVAAQPHAQIVDRIRAQGIEVLFDLRGWGGGGAPAVLAMRPAPVQVNWLAYPGTSGAPWIDYVLADGFVLPPALRPHFSEAAAILPRCFQPSDTARAIAPPPARADCGLADDAVVYCCFNNSYKTNPASFARAMAVLRAVPDGVLWLLSGPGRADERLREAAHAAGVDTRRLVFMAKQPHAAYLARLQLADLFLDSTPYNAHTTASDALWAGCPVLTRPGETFASRVAGSLNHHLGLDELNAGDDDAYIAFATAVGNDRPRLRDLRARLQQLKRASGLFDMAGFARDFAAIARRMVERHRDGLMPAPLELG